MKWRGAAADRRAPRSTQQVDLPPPLISLARPNPDAYGDAGAEGVPPGSVVEAEVKLDAIHEVSLGERRHFGGWNLGRAVTGGLTVEKRLWVSDSREA